MINLEVLAQAIFEGAAEALGSGAKVVEARAKHLAPVRHIFADVQKHIRFKSISEIEADRVLRVTLGLGRETHRGPFAARTLTGKRPPVHWRRRRLAVAEQLLAEYEEEMNNRRSGGIGNRTTLTRQGAYEVRHKRAVFSSWQHLNIGGRLRGEIFSTPPSIAGQQAEAWVISPTPYAKYQEFGTRHNAAHPFLRPAAAESQAAIVSQIAAAVSKAIRTGAMSTDIEILVRL